MRDELDDAAIASLRQCPFIYRLTIDARDPGDQSFGRYRLTASAACPVAFIQADIDDGYIAQDARRAQMGIWPQSLTPP